VSAWRPCFPLSVYSGCLVRSFELGAILRTLGGVLQVCVFRLAETLGSSLMALQAMGL
jgi:hypothetical protein